MESKNLNELGLIFSRKHIARNGHFYRVAKPNKEFWAYYEEHEQELEDRG